MRKVEEMRTRRPNVNEDMYNKIKKLTDAGFSNKDVYDQHKYKEDVVGNVRNTDNYNLYKEMRDRLRIAKNNKSKQIEIPIVSITKVKEVPVPAITKIEGIAELTKEIKMLREAIYVVRSDNKKGWFNARN